MSRVAGIASIETQSSAKSTDPSHTYDDRKAQAVFEHVLSFLKEALWWEGTSECWQYQALLVWFIKACWDEAPAARIDLAK